MGLEVCVVSLGPSALTPPGVTNAYSLLASSLNIQASGRTTGLCSKELDKLGHHPLPPFWAQTLLPEGLKFSLPGRLLMLSALGRCCPLLGFEGMDLQVSGFPRGNETKVTSLGPLHSLAESPSWVLHWDPALSQLDLGRPSYKSRHCLPLSGVCMQVMSPHQVCFLICHM